MAPWVSVTTNPRLFVMADHGIDKATSELTPAGVEDMALNLEICDQIRSKAASAKDAMRALKRRLNHKNPNVQLLALGVGFLPVSYNLRCNHLGSANGRLRQERR